MTFHKYQIQLVAKKREELLTKANSGLSSQEDLAILQNVKQLLIRENKLKENYELLSKEQKELNANLTEKQKLSAILKELSELKLLMINNQKYNDTNKADTEEDDSITVKQKTVLASLAQLLPIEEKTKARIVHLETKLKNLADEVNLLIESIEQENQLVKNKNHVLIEKVTQILEKPISN